MADNSVLRRFELAELTAEAAAQITANSAAYRTFAEQLLGMAPAGRELSSALTALEEAKFWTNQAVAINGAAPVITPTEPVVTDPTDLETRDA